LSKTISPNTTLSHYRIVSRLGAGGMGEVYLARDISELDRTLAIKLLPSEVAADPKRMHRFIQEAKTVSALNHPNVLTIYEFGQEGATRFIATEYVEGVTLREHLRTHRLKLHEALDIATQVAAALDAAHEAHVVHRDIKPDNIMVRRRDHIVKLLDFGLAKPVGQILESEARVDTEAGTKVLVNTEPGVVLGTASYMSPEQSTGSEHVDHRTDIWSLGVVLYEMIAGRRPFEGKDVHREIIAIQEQAPTPLSRHTGGVPERLEDIVTKALAKDPDERYQTAKDLLIDLRNLKRRLEVDAEIDRTVPPEMRTSATSSDQSVAATSSGAAATLTTERRSVSSAEYIVSEIKRHKKSVAVTGTVLFALVLATAGYLFFARRTAALTDKDTILLTDFVNTTGDPVFDGTLKQGLAVQLGQSPFLDLVADTRVRQTLRLMGRSPDDRVTAEIGREICQRQGIKALITGSIASLGSHYVLTLEAVNSQSGEVVAREQGEAESKEQVLKTLSQAAINLREKLGESLSSLEKFDAPLEVTTSSLAALKAYSLAADESNRGKWLEAIEHHKLVLELDSNFAMAYNGLAVCYANTAQPKLAAENISQAYALRDRVSELERLRITSFYYWTVLGDFDKYIEALELYKRTYPRDARPYTSLSVAYDRIGQWEKSAQEAGEAIRMNPNVAAQHGNLARALIRLHRYDESVAVLDRAINQLKLDSEHLRVFVYHNAFIRGDAATMKQQIDLQSGKRDEYLAFDWQTNSAVFAGKWRQAQDHSRRAIDLAANNNAKEVAAQYAAEAALRAAVFGQCAQTKSAAAQGLSFERNQVSLTRSGLAQALCGDVGQAQSLVNELTKEYPQFTVINGIWLPTLRAALELARGNSAQALTELQAASRYEAAGEFWPQYIRGQTYLKLGKAAEAAVEFQKILDHRGYAPMSPLYALAHVGLARAGSLQGDAAKARKAYQDFLALWKDADSDIPILIDAKKEYEKLTKLA
jgi:serine/threonine protein kinase/Tfp pilus assembly protein PilF